MEHVPPPLRSGDLRPPHRLGHQCHERRAVGRADAGRRGLRREPQLLPPGGGRSDLLRVPVHRSRPTRAGGPSTSCRGCSSGAGDVVPGNMYFTTTRLHQELAGGTIRRRDRGRGARPGQHLPVQGQRRPGQARTADRRGRPRADPLRLRRGHREHGWRPAHLHREPPRRARADPRARHQGDPGRHPGRRERVLHQGAGAGILGMVPRRTSCWRPAASRTVAP